MDCYLALLLSLPTGNATLRMRVWRALKTTGCGVLRDGVYLLPPAAPGTSALNEAEKDVRAAGGFAMIVEMKFNAEQVPEIRRLFDRTGDYGELVARIGAARTALQRLGKRKADTLVQRLHRSLASLAAIDFHPGPAQRQADDAMAALDRELQRLFSGGEPRSSKKTPRRLDPAKYRNRVWATRQDLWVDRLASAWLIKRFIDREATFQWLARPRDRPRRAIGFDFDGADFTHAGSRVTYEVLLASFGFDNDPGLAAIGQAVHFLDIGGIPVADASGLETLLKGIKAKARNDDDMAAQAMKAFDFFYSAYSRAAA